MSDEYAKAWPDPASRALEGCEGYPATLADGREWLLRRGVLGDGLDEVRDRLDDASRLTGSLLISDVYHAAVRMLAANYELDGDELVGLVTGAPERELVVSVWRALFGVRGRVTYSSWASSAFLANGLDPASIPIDLIEQTLGHLIATGRAVPAEKVIHSALESEARAEFTEMARRQAIPKAPTGPAVVLSGPGAPAPGP